MRSGDALRRDVLRMAQNAVYAVDGKPNGIYCVDLREDKDGPPTPTEINATTSTGEIVLVSMDHGVHFSLLSSGRVRALRD